MGYGNLQSCVRDLERTGQLLRIPFEVDACLEAAEIHRRVHDAGGPAILFERVRGCQFPMVSNLFGTMERARFIFRDALASVEMMIRLKKDPTELLRHPFRIPSLLRTAVSMRCPKRSNGPVMECQTTLAQLPQLKCWPNDGGAFITLPQVYTEHPARPGFMNSNLGMYRVQISGNQYASDEVGLHYQIHRSIGFHHAAAIEQGKPLRVNIFVGGSPALAVSAVMPLPDGIPELAFAGALSRHAVRMIRQKNGPMICAEADFCISGTIDPDRQLPEGPFGDHLGYYSLTHDFPVVKVDHVYHRRDAIWPFTVVGRPPQEDTIFGELIHELTGPAIPAVLPGVHAVHAVDAAGVHPLLLAIGSERYVPYAEDRIPQELLTNANAILGQGQLSLAKYLIIAAKEDDPALDINDIPQFFQHVLSRVDWRRDLHFQTCTTMDTLDYTGTSINAGSKLVIAAAGKPRRRLGTTVPSSISLSAPFCNPRVCMPGILAITGPAWGAGPHGQDSAAEQLCRMLESQSDLTEFPLILLVDDSSFCADSIRNFLWVTFTRSNPAADIFGVHSFQEQKHWGCLGPLVIDARIKAHMAPPLEVDPQVSAKVDALFAQGKIRW
ncbi:MAG: UbiD family decarboxylase [Planctomyces sp.]|nr:UbiD family decarboxylase [Planctomyces sp.]